MAGFHFNARVCYILFLFSLIIIVFKITIIIIIIHLCQLDVLIVNCECLYPMGKLQSSLVFNVLQIEALYNTFNAEYLKKRKTDRHYGQFKLSGCELLKNALLGNCFFFFLSLSSTEFDAVFSSITNCSCVHLSVELYRV